MICLKESTDTMKLWEESSGGGGGISGEGWACNGNLWRLWISDAQRSLG